MDLCRCTAATSGAVLCCSVQCKTKKAGYAPAFFVDEGSKLLLHYFIHTGSFIVRDSDKINSACKAGKVNFQFT